MELREWLIILGLALVSLIVIDGVRRLQRQRRVPRLDQAVSDTPASRSTEFDDAAKEAEINWELPNGGARVVKPADYSGLSQKPKLERQEHPGPSKILSQFKRSTSMSKASSSAASTTPRTADAATSTRAQRPEVKMPESTPAPEEHQREPTTSSYSEDTSTATAHREPRLSAMDENEVQRPTTSEDDTPVLRAEPEDAAFAKHATAETSTKRRQLRSDIAGEHPDDDDDEESYRLVDFEEIGRSLKQRMIAHRKARMQKKAEKARRAEALAKQKAERKAIEAEQRREAEEAAEAERARIAQEQAQARELAAQAAEEERLAQAADMARYAAEEDTQPMADEQAWHEPEAQEGVVRTHPALEKALRHDVCGEHAKETLTNAEEVVVISVLSRDPAGFDGGKLLELMMACGLRYSRPMGVFHRFETESDDSELQFSMVNVVKPGTFPIEEMDEFVTPGITLLMPLPGANDSSAAFEAMVETAMVVVRHMGGELKDENHSVMTAQTIEFARQRVHEFERRHRLHRHMQAH